MEKIIVEKRLFDELNDLIEILYKDEYFSFLQSAEEYVNKIYAFINTIPNLKSKKAKINRFGNYFCTYKANKNTSWYLFFDVEDGIFLISFITNNHSANYPKLI